MSPCMTLGRTVLIFAVVWVSAISLLHRQLNATPDSKGSSTSGEAKLQVGFIPVTCHLTCPVTDFINKSMTGKSTFRPLRFSGFPELKEALISGHIEAGFILAPLAMVLRQQGVKMKIVYLGHRDGTALMVRKDSDVHSIQDLRGKRIAVPNRFSNQYLLLFKVLRERGLSLKDIELVELPPPDMPAALYAKAVDAITSGEPFMAQTELDGYGRVLYLTKDVWPNFISCVLVVREDVIQNQRGLVQTLVDGIARSGKWLDSDTAHRNEAAQFVAKNYYNQHPRLLSYVLSKPPDRVRYTNLSVRRRDFEEIEQLAREAGVLKGAVTFDSYADDSFVKEDTAVVPWDFQAAAQGAPL